MRGETKRVELEMMREALNKGVPPPLVPLMFLGPTLKASSGEWVNEYLAQQLGIFQQQQQPHPGAPRHPGSPPPGHVLRRETRSIQQMHPQAPAPAMGPPTTNSQTTYMPYQPTAGPMPRPGHQGHSPVQTQLPPQQAPPQQRQSLPRINTNEMQPLPPNVTMQIPMGPPSQQSHGAPPPPPPPPPSSAQAPPQQQPEVIFFHHWQPPNTQSASGSSSAAQATVSPQRQQLDSPFSHHPPPNALSSGQDFSGSPKKRKNTSSQPQQPPPVTSQPFSPKAAGAPSPAASVTASSRARRAHSRQRSDTAPSAQMSRPFEHYPRTTRQRRSVGSGDPPADPTPISQYPPITSPMDSRDARNSHYNVTMGDRQQSAPPPPRPYSAGSGYRSQQLPYNPSPPAQPSTADVEHKQ